MNIVPNPWFPKKLWRQVLYQANKKMNLENKFHCKKKISKINVCEQEPGKALIFLGPI